MVDVGDCRRRRIADRFRIVEVIMPRISASDKEPINGMVGAVRKAPLSQLIVAWIFVEQAGEDGRRHVRTNAIVSKRGAKALSVGVPALTPLFWIILWQWLT